MAEFNIKLKSKSNFKVIATSGGVQVPARFQDLIDFDQTNKNDKYVIMFNGATQKYELVNPDEVLNAAAATETLQPGLVGFATAFLDRVDIDLDDRIDVDGGSF